MTYREQLNKLEELGIMPTSKADVMTTDAVAKCINDIVKTQRALSFRTTNQIVEEILKMDKWDFIDKASNYLD